MAHTFKISTFGLTLIKAYEGFRPIETTLVSGQRVIGYGHRFQDSEEPAVTRKQAENLLREDLAAYEDVVNENVHAPLTQSQFDALVSLSFNIGPKAFLSSDVLQMLNNGRPLDAAAGFDQWRKSVIDGKTYVVDALVRRRTAEKALFLRASEGVVSAPRLELPPKRDLDVTAGDTDTFVFDKSDAVNLVPTTPYSAQTEPEEKKETGPLAGSTALYPEGESREEETNSSRLSPIALAAEEVSERLDRLIADDPNGEAHITVSPQAPPTSPSVPEERKPSQVESKDIPVENMDNAVTLKAANEGTREDYRRPANGNSAKVRTPDAYIQNAFIETPVEEKGPSFAPYWLSMMVGAAMLGGGLVKWFLKPDLNPGELSQFVVPAVTIIGAMIVLGSLYYLAKTFKRKTEADD